MRNGDVLSWVDPDHGNQRFEGVVQDVKGSIVTYVERGSRGPMRYLSLHRVHGVALIEHGGGLGHGSWRSDV